MKKNLILKIGLIIFVVLILYLYESFQWKSPQIKTTIELKNVTEEEYSKKIDLHKCDYNGLKNLYVEINLKKSNYYSVKEINIPELNAIDHIDRIRTVYGGYTNSDYYYKNNNLTIIKYLYFDSSGLSLADLKKLYSDEEITITLNTPKNKELRYVYDIGDLLMQ